LAINSPTGRSLPGRSGRSDSTLTRRLSNTEQALRRLEAKDSHGLLEIYRLSHDLPVTGDFNAIHILIPENAIVNFGLL
jgi:hypothetical protein